MIFEVKCAANVGIFFDTPTSLPFFFELFKRFFWFRTTVDWCPQTVANIVREIGVWEFFVEKKTQGGNKFTSFRALRVRHRAPTAPYALVLERSSAK